MVIFTLLPVATTAYLKVVWANGDEENHSERRERSSGTLASGGSIKAINRSLAVSRPTIASTHHICGMILHPR